MIDETHTGAQILAAPGVTDGPPSCAVDLRRPARAELPDRPSPAPATGRCPLLEAPRGGWVPCCTARFLPLARRVAGSREAAEDVLHDTWIIAIEKVHQYRGRGPACGWVRTIVRREAQHAVARRRRETPLDDRRRNHNTVGARPAAPRSAGAASPEEEAHRREMARLLREVVDALPPIYREVVRVRDFEERSGHGAAVRLDVSRSAVATRRHRAHRLVRERMRRRIGALGATAARR